MEDNQNFCVKCGQYLQEGVRFCPACGYRVPGRSPEQVEAERETIRDFMASRLKWAAVIMAVYSIPFLIIGIYISYDVAGIVNELMTNPSYAEYIDYYGVSESELHDLIQYSGMLYLVSSLCGLASAAMCVRRRFFWPALILCLVSVFTGVAGLFGLLMGMLAFWMILSGKLVFQEYEDRLDAELSKIR